jgi:type II secretory pathway component GspD/PulD (secretin)
MLRFVNLSVVLLLSAAAFAAGKEVASKPASAAPQEIPELLVPRTPKMTAIIKLHHVKPALMAFWLDSKNFVNPEPIADCVTGLPTLQQNPVSSPSPFKNRIAKTELELPQGTDAIVSIEAQSALLVRGTKEAVEEIQQLIALWDVPPKQVQADVTIYQLNRETLEKLGSSDKPVNIENHVFFFKDTDQKIIDAAIAGGQAKTLAMPKLITHNNQGACIELTNTEGEKKQAFGLSMVPTVNGDGTLTVLVQPLVRQSKSMERDAPLLLTEQKVQTIFMVRDGDTVAIALPSKEHQNWLYLITPRLLKEKLAKEQREAPLK